MKIGVISDTHGVVPAWEKAMGVFDGVDLIIHAGDMLYHPRSLGCTPGYDLPGLVKLMNESAVPIIAARGNCDPEVYEELLDFPVQAPYALVEADGLRMVVTHGHTLSDDELGAMATKYRANVIITGHTHLPLADRLPNGAVHLNPGSPSHPKLERDGRPSPTVALIEGGMIRVVDINTGDEYYNVAIR